MPEVAPGDPPSRWTVLNDYSKTVVTLGGALLAFIAAFSDKLQVIQSGAWPRGLLIAALALLLLSVGFALTIPAWMDRYLRICAAGAPAAGNPEASTETEWNVDRRSAVWWCKLSANLSFLTLFLAAFALGAFALVRLTTTGTPKTEADALTAANTLLLSFSGIVQPQWQTQSLTYDPATDAYEVVTFERTSLSKFKVNVPRGNSPATAQRLP